MIDTMQYVLSRSNIQAGDVSAVRYCQSRAPAVGNKKKREREMWGYGCEKRMCLKRQRARESYMEVTDRQVDKQLQPQKDR